MYRHYKLVRKYSFKDIGLHCNFISVKIGSAMGWIKQLERCTANPIFQLEKKSKNKQKTTTIIPFLTYLVNPLPYQITLPSTKTHRQP